MIDDKELVKKLKPELKRLKLEHDQVITICIVMKRNPKHLDECLKYLSGVELGTDGENIATEIIDICY
jgi:hypothetical protein